MKIDLPPNTKGIIFDLDGTLVDTMPAHFQSWLKVAEKYNFIFNKEIFLNLAGMPTEKIVDYLNKNYGYSLNPYEVAKEKQQTYIDLIKNNPTIIKPIKEVLEIVKKYYNILPMAIGTGNTKYITNLTLEATNLKKYFNIIVTAEDVKEHKPSPDTFLLCAKKMNVSPEFITVFEDADLGIQAAKNAGMNVIDVRKYISYKI